MNKIKTYLTILSILLLPVSVLASQEDRPGCEMYWGRVLPKIRCLAQPPTVQKATPSQTENPTVSSTLKKEELQRLRKMTLFL